MLKTISLKTIRFYQRYLSLDQGLIREVFIGKNSSLKICRHVPSCSEYTYQAIEKYGIGKGVFKGVKRIGRCNPFNSGGWDPVD